MTKDEAIERLKTLNYFNILHKAEPTVIEALDLAIDSLSAEPNCQKCAIKELWEATEKEDLVSVVRCGDCKHLFADGRCEEFADDGIRPSASDFCSYGERREECD